MATVVSPLGALVVADQFVRQYYAILYEKPEHSHKFYAESSQLGWPDWPDCNGDITHVTTLSSINDKILSSDFKNCFAEISTVDAQAWHDGGVMVTVTGTFLEEDKEKAIFFQNFNLARQAKGFYILNDVLRVFKACGSVTNDVPIVQSDPSDASDISVLEDTVAKVSSSASLVSSGENEPLVVEPASNADVASVVPETNAKVPSAVEPSVSANVSPAVAPAGNGSEPSADKESATLVVAPADKESVPASVAQADKVNVKSVVAKASNVHTYASLVAKTTPATSPKAAPEAAKAAPVAKKVAQVSPKAAPLPLANGAPKATANGEPKPIASTTKVTTKSTAGGNSAPFPEARGVYLGNLPWKVTKHMICEALRKFGPIRRQNDAVQIRKHDDGFCCAFVEFESPDSARLAVEARKAFFGEIESFVVYKKSSYNRGSRSPTRGGYQNGNGNQSNQERSRSSSQGAR